MEHISHDNIFDYLSVDLDMDEESLRNKLFEMGTNNFIEYLKNKELSMFTVDTVLSSELRDSHNHVLINKDISLDKYLGTLLERYVNDKNFTTKAFDIQTSDEILMVYRQKATSKMNSEMDKVINGQEKFKRFYGKIKKGDVAAPDEFNAFMRSLLGGTDGISYMLKMIKNIDFNKTSFTHTTNSTLISLAVAMMHASRSKGLDIRGFLNKVSCACFFQSSSYFTGESNEETSKSDEASASSEIAAQLCNDYKIVEAIRDKFAYKNGSGQPAFAQGKSRDNFYKNLLMTVNIFIDIVKNNQFSPESLEVHKAMFELAKEGYVDKTVASYLGELFLPKLKYQLLEYAFKIQDECRERPVIWGVAGDMLPIKFICKRGECEYSGLHKTLVPQDVEIKAEEIFETKTKRGIYFTCEVLTNKLQVQYRKIQKQLDED